MTMLTENPFPLVMLGLLGVVFGFTFGVITANRKLIWVGILSVLFCVGVVVVDGLVETPREELHRKLHSMARCVRKNDVNGLLEFVSKNESGMGARNRISSEMPRYRFRGCRIANVRHEIDQEAGKAKLTFVAFVNVDASQTSYNYDGMARREVQLRFRKEPDGEWRVVFFDHWEPMSQISL